MASEKETSAGQVPDDRNAMIDRIYDVAIDPSRYEELLDRWEAMIRPIRMQYNGDTGSLNQIADFESHFQRADLFLDRIKEEHDPSARKALVGGYDKSPVLLVDASLHLAEVNDAARAVGLQSGDPLSKLAIDAEDIDALEQAIRRLLHDRPNQTQMFRARLADRDKVAVFQLRHCTGPNEETFAVVISSEMIWPEGFEDVLRDAFAITQAEVGVVRGLVDGKTLREIAEDRERSVETVRAQLRAILSKTDTRSQTELVRLTLSMMDIASVTFDIGGSMRPESKGFSALRPVPYQSFEQEGRRLDYLTLGDPNGRPVLYMQLDFGLIRWPASAEAYAAATGLCVIVLVRPGFGDSTALPKGGSYASGVADCLAALLDHLSVSQCPMICTGSDFYFSVHLADRHPDRISGILACAPHLPLDRPEQYERMHKWHRFIAAGGRYTPHLLPFMVKAGFSLARRIGKRGFIHAVYGDSPSDVATFEDPEVFEAMTCGSEVALSDTHSAHAAFSREIIAQENDDWADVLCRIEARLPVKVYWGTADPQVPPATACEHEESYPGLDYTPLHDSGQLLFFKHWRSLLPELETLR